MSMDVVDLLRTRYKVECRICHHFNSDMSTVHAVMDDAANEIERLRGIIKTMSEGDGGSL